MKQKKLEQEVRYISYKGDPEFLMVKGGNLYHKMDNGVYKVMMPGFDRRVRNYKREKEKDGGG